MLYLFVVVKLGFTSIKKKLYLKRSRARTYVKTFSTLNKSEAYAM